MSLWEFAACMQGLREFHGEKHGGEMSDEQLRDLGIEGFNGDE